MLDKFQEEIIQKGILTKTKKAFWFSLIASLTEMIGFLGYRISSSFLPPYEYVFYARPIYQLVMVISILIALVSINIIRKCQKRSPKLDISLIVAVVVVVSSVYNIVSSLLFPIL